MHWRRIGGGLAGALLLASSAVPGRADSSDQNQEQDGSPIKHVVVIFQENVSFDHYFGTYPRALNPAGEPAFLAAPGTPAVNGLTPALLTANPNLSNPQRLDRSQARTCDLNHDYTDEQKAVNLGKMDRFVQELGDPTDPTGLKCSGKATGAAPNYTVMDYYDGNTVTGLWNYAQRFSMSDNSFGTNYGPSTVGALNLISGNTYGAICTNVEVYCAAGATVGTVTDDPQPAGDLCNTRDSAQMVSGRNVGDLMNDRGVSWGFFEGGFGNCLQSHTYLDQKGVPHQKKDYIPHHQPFQYYPSTANLAHTPPASVAEIGHAGPANHQYDLDRDFWPAVGTHNLPAVSFIKAAGYQDGHPGYSNPLDEQTFLISFLNRLQQTPEWRSTAVFIAYDDSDGWYDHQLGKVVTASQTPRDALSGPGLCGDPEQIPEGEMGFQQGRCGLGPRLPLLAISPYAKRNFVDHHLSDQSSILRFIEDNFDLGRIGNASSDEEAGSLNHMFNLNQPDFTPLRLDPATGLKT